MNKKILVIRGSARAEGYTNALCDYALSLIGECEIINFDVFSESFAPCDGCNFCETAFCCRHRDLNSFFGEFENADLIIFASPVYNGSFSAPLKALVDRFQVYYTSFYAKGKLQPIEKRRKALLFAASGRDGSEAFDYMKKQLASAFSILNTELSGSVLCPFTDTGPQFCEAKEKIRKILSEEEL